MKVICSDGDTFNLDELNAYKPDGEHLYCQFDVTSYKPETIKADKFGTFIKTSDNGVIYFSSIVFKMLIDMSIKAGLESTKYLKAEIDRARTDDESAEESLIAPKSGNAIANMLKRNNIEGIRFANVEKIVKSNLRVLNDYDIVNDWAKTAIDYNGEYVDAYLEFIKFINEYLYIKKQVCSFHKLHEMMTDLFSTFSSDEFRDFVKKFYEMLDKIPEAVYTERRVAFRNSTSTIKSTKIVEDELDGKKEVLTAAVAEAVEDVKDAEDVEPEDTFADKTMAISKKVKRLSGEDITGKDETYAVNYCELFYDKELENADSEGFLEKLILSRANETAAPIDLLSEAIQREHVKDTPVNTLRSNLADMRKSAEASVSNM